MTRFLPTMLMLAGTFLMGCPDAADDATADDDDATAGDDDDATADDDDATAGDDDDVTPADSPVYVTVAGHLEDNEVYANCDAWPEFREELLVFADLIAASGVSFNLQIEYEFLLGAYDCETPDLTATTDGRNVVDYLAVQYGFEIDAHQEGGWEEGQDNYADVRHLGGLVTGGISEVVGGFKWDDTHQFDELHGGEQGWLYPEFTWFPEILSLGVHTLHHEGNFDHDDLTSGVWIPAGGDTDFLTHEPANRMVYVGPGLQHQNWGGGDCFFHNGAEYAQVLADYMERGDVPGDALYTTTIAIPQSAMLDAAEHGAVTDILAALAPLHADGRVAYATYSEVVDLWTTQFAAQPNIFTFDRIDPTDYTCP